MTQKRGGGRSRIPSAVREKIEDFALRGWAPKEIYDSLQKLGDPYDAVHLRTVQMYARRFAPPDPSGPWELAESAPADAAVIAPILFEVKMRIRWGEVTCSLDQARWILRIRGIAPNLNPWAVWLLGRLYVARRLRGEQTTDLDDLLGCAAAGSQQDWWGVYREVISRGRIIAAPNYILAAIVDPDRVSAGLASVLEEQEDTDFRRRQLESMRASLAVMDQEYGPIATVEETTDGD